MISMAKLEKPKLENERAFAHYKIINGRRFFRNNDWPDRFIEVGLKAGYKNGKKYLQVVPINEAHIKQSIIP